MARADNKNSLLQLLKNKNSFLKELGGKQSVGDLKQQFHDLLDKMRFPDGRSLQDRLKDMEAEREIERKLAPNEDLEKLMDNEDKSSNDEEDGNDSQSSEEESQ